MEFKQVTKAEVIHNYDSNISEQDYISIQNIKKAIEIGKKLLKNGFYCRHQLRVKGVGDYFETIVDEPTQFYFCYRIPATDVVMSIQVVANSKNTCLVRGCSSIYVGDEDYQAEDDLDMTEYLIGNNPVRYADLSKQGEFMSRKCDDELELRNAILEWINEVDDVAEAYKNRIKEEYKELIKLTNNVNNYRDYVVADGKYKLSVSKKYVNKVDSRLTNKQKVVQ